MSRYNDTQLGQSPEDYHNSSVAVALGDDVMVGLDSGDPCDPNSQAYDPYNYDCGSQDSAGADWLFCEKLVVAVPMPPLPVRVPTDKGEQLYYKMTQDYYKMLQNYVSRRKVEAPNGTVTLPFRPVQVSETGDILNDFYTDDEGHFLVFADVNSQEWYQAGLDQFCPSYVGLPTGQCQDIPGYQCEMGGEPTEAMMGASAATRIVVRKTAAPKAGKRFVWRKMTPAEKAQQLARYRAGGTSRSPQKGMPLSAKSRAAVARRVPLRAASRSNAAQAQANRLRRASQYRPSGTVQPSRPNRAVFARR